MRTDEEWADIFRDIVEDYVQELGTDKAAMLLVQHLVALAARHGSGAHVFAHPVSGNKVTVEVSELFAAILSEELTSSMKWDALH